MKRVSILEIVESPNWIPTESGLKVFNAIYPVIKSGEGVELSFAGKTFVTTAFLNAAIGRLYNGEFTDDYLSAMFHPVDMTESDSEKLTRVVANAKIYYAAPLVHDAVLNGDAD